MYRIIGGDQKEYGPVSVEQLRQWIAEGRANAQTQVCPEGSTGWKPLAALPEFASLFGPAAVPPPVGTPPGGAYRPPAAKLSNYLVPAILCTLFCCLPFGIPAIVFAAQVNSKAAVGDQAGAQAAAAKAKLWCWLAFGVGLAVAAIYVVVIAFGVAHRLR